MSETISCGLYSRAVFYLGCFVKITSKNLIFRIYRSKQWYHDTFKRKSHFRIGVIAIGLCIWKKLYLVIFVSAFVTFESFTFLSRPHTCRDFWLPISISSFHLLICTDSGSSVHVLGWFHGSGPKWTVQRNVLNRPVTVKSFNLTTVHGHFHFQSTKIGLGAGPCPEGRPCPWIPVLYAA